MTTDAAVSIHCRVHDEARLYRGAFNHLRDECGYAPRLAKDVLASGGFVDVGACLQMLLHPGSPPLDAGFEIMDSSSETYHKSCM